MSFRETLYESYAQHPSHAVSLRSPEQDRVFRRHLRNWLPEDPGIPILDLGCGDGALLGFLHRAGHRQLVGVDRSPIQAERSRGAAPEAEVILGAGGDVLRQRPDGFGVIFCIDVLEHLTRDELLETLALIRKALRPGGALVARVPNAESPFHDAIRYGDLTHETGFAPGALAHLFRVTGFEDVAFRECDPVAKNAKGLIRALVWRLLRQLVRAWNLVETGDAGSGVYTRVVYVRARRP